MQAGSDPDIERSVEQLLTRSRRLVLAVSGGADSAALLDAVSRRRTADHDVLVASVDHGTGEAATEATAMTLAAAARAGLPAVSERLDLPRHDEATLREGRWKFLRQVSAMHAGPVVTAHTLDDHIETVVMRILRGSSARGLAGLLADSPVERPFLALRRRATRDYVRRRRIPFVDDPSNESLRYFRNRVRLQLLPALRGVNPGFESEILDISRRASALRTAVNEVASGFLVRERDRALTLNAEALRELPDASLWLLLPALMARAGITLDRRGLARLASVVRARPGSSGQLSGGFEAVRSREGVTISRPAPADPSILKLRAKGETRFGAFRFWAEPGTTIQSGKSTASDAWRIYIPRNAEPVVRQWYPGDRLRIDLSGGSRRVKRFFADAGVVGPLRAGWPVVLCGDDVIWIPGIKASQAAVSDAGKMVHYTCERIRE